MAIVTANPVPLAGKNDLLAISDGTGPSNFPRLPKPGMLMLDRITGVSTHGGKHGLGVIEAEFDIKPSLWFFDCHFSDDPIMPGSLGVDGLCQLLGYFLGTLGFEGHGRALGVGKVRYKAEIRPVTQVIDYRLDIRSIKNAGFPFAIADGQITSGKTLFTQASGISVGIRPIPADCAMPHVSARTEQTDHN